MLKALENSQLGPETTVTPVRIVFWNIEHRLHTLLERNSRAPDSRPLDRLFLNTLI